MYMTCYVSFALSFFVFRSPGIPTPSGSLIVESSGISPSVAKDISIHQLPSRIPHPPPPTPSSIDAD